jgi:DNA repair protein RadC
LPESNAPLSAPADALAVVFAALAEPRRPETIALLLDGQHRGSIVLICSDVSQSIELGQLAALLLEVAAAHATLGAVVLATSRPRGGIVPTADDERVFAGLRHDLAAASVELLDWFLIDGKLVGSVAELSGACWLWQAEEPSG